MSDESVCERCGGPNPSSWHAPSPLWNAVMRGGRKRERFGFCCPTCFIIVAGEHGITSPRWHLAIDGEDYEGTVNTDGRVWNPSTCLWEAR